MSRSFTNTSKLIHQKDGAIHFQFEDGKTVPRSLCMYRRIIDPETDHLSISMNTSAISPFSSTDTGDNNDTNSGLSNDNNNTNNNNNNNKKVSSLENTNQSTTNNDSNTTTIPETVLQYERQIRKIRAASRANQTTLTPSQQHLHILYSDEHIIVTHKPSGILCVPGIHQNPSLLQLVYDAFGCTMDQKEQMIVHRLDMDTSGVVVFARSKESLKGLHESFRERKVTKIYEALVCGKVTPSKGEINLPLQRDHRYPPFMRIPTPRSEIEASIVVRDLIRHAGYKKLLKKAPKESITNYKVVRHDLYDDEFPVTRVELFPITGRTHQLRVHCAAIGHPIVADPSYGIYGEASPNGGFDECTMDIMSPDRASLSLQQSIERVVTKRGQCMCLHAKVLEMPHPMTGEWMTFQAETPF